MEVFEFIHEVAWDSFPEAVRNQARRCLLDTLGAALAGRQTPLSAIIHEHAAAVYGGRGAHLWLDGREVSPPGAALAHGSTIDALDIHDGHNLVKGHAGAALVPATLAMAGSGPGDLPDGRELLTALVMGYEVALRAGISLHASACDYHTSGAWNALGCAAIAARRLGLDRAATRHALGIAEYHGPRSQMMRCIDHPTMVKDGSGWGAMAGVSAALLAGRGFTGAPAVTLEDPAGEAGWADLGGRWRILEQYFKPQAICRWAQPAVEAVLHLQRLGRFDLSRVREVRVHSFHEAVRLTVRRPANTEEAQYSLPYPVAAALTHGRLGPSALLEPALTDTRILALADRVALIEDPALSARFPEERIARVEIEMDDGRVLQSGPFQARWGAEDSPSDEALQEKFRWLAGESLPPERVEALEKWIWTCADLPNVAPLLAALAAPR